MLYEGMAFPLFGNLSIQLVIHCFLLVHLLSNRTNSKLINEKILLPMIQYSKCFRKYCVLLTRSLQVRFIYFLEIHFVIFYSQPVISDYHMFDLEFFIDPLFYTGIFSHKLCYPQNVLLNSCIKLFLKHSEDVLRTNKAVSIIVVQEECNHMRLTSFHWLKTIAELLKLFESDVSAKLIEVFFIEINT